MRRRQFITLIAGSIVAWPPLSRAQQPAPIRRVGVLLALSKDNADAQARVAALRGGLEALGWKSGQNVRIDVRWSDTDDEHLRSEAAQLIARKPDVIVAAGSRVMVRLQEQTGAIPIVFIAQAGSSDHGIITNFARPAGNLTGFTTFDSTGLAGKMLGSLKEIAPGLSRTLLIMSHNHPSTVGYQRQLAEAAPRLGIVVTTIEVATAAELEHEIIAFAREPDGGLLLPADQFHIQHRDLILALATRYRLPASYAYRSHVTAGGLMSYGVDFNALYGAAASYVDRILKGDKPSDLPVQAPTRYELVINLNTAKALGLTVSPILLAQADEVIE
jgi:putative ABC transport system substrate-binding protein